MRSLFIVIFSLFFIGDAVAAPPPGLYDDPKAAVNLPAQKKKTASAKARGYAVPNAIMGNSEEHSFRKNPNEPLFSSSTSSKPIEDDNILGIDFDKITDMGKDLWNKFTSDNKPKDKEKTENAANNNPPLVSAMPPVTEHAVKSEEEKKEIKKTAAKSFRIPITIYNRHASEEDFLNDLYTNMPDIKPKDLKLESLRAEEELKKKQEALAAEKKRQEAEVARAKAEAKKVAETKRANVTVKKIKKKRKSKRELLVDKVYDMSIAGLKLGMTPAEVLAALKDSDFVVQFSNNSIPKFLEWQYRRSCLKNPVYRKSDLQTCIKDEADKAHANYVNRMNLKHRVNNETMTLTFSSFYAGNKLYRIEYHTLGDNSLGNSERDNYFRGARARDFMLRLRRRYGNPDNERNMVWGSDKDAVTMRAFVSGANVNGSIILEDARIGARDENIMVQSANRVHYGDEFSF